MLVVTTYLLNPFVPASNLRYLQVGEVALVGLFAIHTISMTSYSLSISYSEQTAKSIRSLIRIAGTIIVIAVVISYLSQNPVIAASISTISGLRIGDRIRVFNWDGRVSDIGLL